MIGANQCNQWAKFLFFSIAGQGVDFPASCWRGHFNKLLYEDFGVYIEQIVVRSERVVRAPRLSDNLLYANRKPKDHKSA